MIESRFGNQSIPEELKVEQQIAYNYYVELQRMYRELSISEDLMSGGLEVIVDDDVPTSPVNPRPVRNGVLAFFLGAILGLGMAFLADYLDDSIESREEVQRLYDSPVLGEIPRYRELVDEQRRSGLVMISEPKSPISESFRALRTNPSELIGSRRMNELLARAKSQADFVLIDTPPVLAVSDAAAKDNTAAPANNGNKDEAGSLPRAETPALITRGMYDDIDQYAAYAAMLYFSESESGGREEGGKDCGRQ